MAISSPVSIALFGSTGSIGVNTLDVVRNNPGKFIVSSLAAHRNIEVLRQQIKEFHPKVVAIADSKAAKELRSLDPGCEILEGDQGLRELALRGDYDVFVGALVGFAGLAPTVEAMRLGKRIALANKETLVVAGELLTKMAVKSGSKIIPIDSEHSAIYQCLVGEISESIRKIILTASGGPFRTMSKELFSTITPAMALKHPKWEMGAKITIDSATLMNKGLEILEAKWLFGVELDQIDVIVHPQSIVHSFVEFSDGSMKAQLGMPDMRLAIQYALTTPERLPVRYSALDLAASSPLDFFEPDYEKFPSLNLAREAGVRGGLAPCVLNAANEIAVAAFLSERIPFIRIPELIEEALTSFDVWELEKNPEGALEQIMQCDKRVREWTLEELKKETVSIT